MLLLVIDEQEKNINLMSRNYKKNLVSRNYKKSVISCKFPGNDLKALFIFLGGANSKSQMHRHE